MICLLADAELVRIDQLVPDMHAMDDGLEYFAIAIEMLRHYPESFCVAYDANERAWLEANLGECLEQLPFAASCP